MLGSYMMIYSPVHLMLGSRVKYVCAVIFWGHTVAQFLEALRKNLECRSFDFR